MNRPNITIHQNFDDKDIEKLAKCMTSSQSKLDFLNEYNFIGGGFSDYKKIEEYLTYYKDKVWLIKENDSGLNVGFISFEPAIFNNKEWQLIIYLDKDYKGKGYAVESIRQLLIESESIIEKTSSNTIKANTRNDNKAAQNALENNGFVLKNEGALFKEYIYEFKD
ncbi:MAG: GNAT family N-acetyltransferase [Ignavibacteria bacterium]